MKTEGLFKKLLLLILLFPGFVSNAQELPDSVIMTIADKPVFLNEFLFMAGKNGEVDFSDEESLKSYVELFKNFKLKVAAADAEGLSLTKRFRDEYDLYKAQLTSDYLSDKEGQEQALRCLYERYGEVLELTHILFKMEKPALSADTLCVFEKANDAFRRITQSESFESVGRQLAEENPQKITYEYVRSLLPLQTVKVFEDVAYALPVGVVSAPVRTTLGYHIIKIQSRRPNPGIIKTAHILIPFSGDTVVDTALEKVNMVYRKALAGESFSDLASKYSSDESTAKKGGVLPPFGPGEMIDEFEQVAYSLQIPGDISAPVKTRFGYHIICLLERPEIQSFDQKKKDWSRKMAQGERNFVYYKTFDEKMKKEYGYKFYPEAYAALQALSDSVFPTTADFYQKAKDFNDVLFRLDNKSYTQADFANYIASHPYSTKSYAGDFMREVYDLYVRELATAVERNNLSVKYPEFSHLLNEYRDGILLFEISNKEVWSQPGDQQSALEADWILRLNRTIPVVINWNLLKKIKK